MVSGESVRLMRPMRLKGPGKVCALCALCAVRVRAANFRVVDFGPEGCRSSPSGCGSAIDEAEGHELFESQVDAVFAYMAVEEGPDLDPG
jgi:hypothetical protein